MPVCNQPCGITGVTLSQNLLKHLKTNESNLQKLTPEEREEDWVHKLKCIDDAHSLAYGLDRDGINDLFTRVEEKINNYFKCPCSGKSIETCMKYNPHCPLNCSRECNEYINCLDAARYEILARRQAEFEHCKMEKLKEERRKARTAKKKL